VQTHLTGIRDGPPDFKLGEKRKEVGELAPTPVRLVASALPGDADRHRLQALSPLSDLHRDALAFSQSGDTRAL